jgi:histidinol-phosphate aminotransferase
MTATISRRTLIGVPPALLAGAAVSSFPRFARAQYAVPAGAPANAIRLAANENPQGPGPAARAAIQAAIADSWKYPMGEEMTLRKQIAEREGLTQQQVMIGDGSSEILHIAAILYGLDRGELITATPTFSLAADHAKAIGASVKAIPLDAEMRYDLKAIRAAISPNTRLIYVCNPNNPTGTTVPGAELREFVAGVSSGSAVLVDEAYLELASDMAENSAVARVRAGDNVIVARTFSKLHGLAGLRIGYALARPDIIEKMARLKLTVASSLGLAAATASYNDIEFQESSRRNIAEGVTITVAALQGLKLRFAPTKANFVFFDTGQPVAQFLAAMRQAGFALGRPFPPFDTWCRVSIGKVDEMRAFAEALRKHYAAT